jgi:LPXTG-motif cell wall-anchored protein
MFDATLIGARWRATVKEIHHGGSVKRFLLVLALVTGALITASPGQVGAQQPPARPCSSDPTHPSYPSCVPRVTPGTAGSLAPGATLTLTAADFCPGVVVTFRVGGTVVGTAIPNASGVASLVIAAPSSGGTFTTTAESAAPCALVASGSITVVAPAPPAAPPAGELPRTGAEPMNWLRTGGIALLVGLGMVGAARLRRRPLPTA